MSRHKPMVVVCIRCVAISSLNYIQACIMGAVSLTQTPSSPYWGGKAKHAPHISVEAVLSVLAK